MSAERDFTRVTFKVNAAGSWATLVNCDVDEVDAVKAACAVIAKAGHVKFKYVDAAGGTIEEYSQPRAGMLYAWHEPKR